MIITELERLLELTGQITPGEWGMFGQQVTHITPEVRKILAQTHKYEDVTFIASAQRFLTPSRILALMTLLSEQATVIRRMRSAGYVAVPDIIESALSNLNSQFQ